MTRGGTIGHRVLLLVAILATFSLLGSWDNRRQLQRVLDDGYEASAEITGAQFQRAMPFALDGWRPRFVEQDLSVDLKWQGRDGKPREHRRVPVTEGFSDGIVSGDQVRLVTLPIKALDDSHAVPVIRADAAARLGSLRSWSAMSGYVALAAWAGFALLALWLRRREDETMRAGGPPVAFPVRRTIFGLMALVGGAIMAFHAWSDGNGLGTMSGGTEAVAQIIDATTAPAKDGGADFRSVRLSWRDPQGAVHHFGPMPISEAYWRRIAPNGSLAIRQTTIRYLPQDLQKRPVIVDDAAEPTWLGRFGSAVGIVLMMVGAGCLFSAARHLRR